MDTHKNAPLTPKGRGLMVRAVVDGGVSKAAVARQFHTAPKAVGEWVKLVKVVTVCPVGRFVIIGRARPQHDVTEFALSHLDDRAL